jgi:hypothetical protein
MSQILVLNLNGRILSLSFTKPRRISPLTAHGLVSEAGLQCATIMVKLDRVDENAIQICHTHSKVESADAIFTLSVFPGSFTVFHIGSVNDIQTVIAIAKADSE